MTKHLKEKKDSVTERAEMGFKGECYRRKTNKTETTAPSRYEMKPTRSNASKFQRLNKATGLEGRKRKRNRTKLRRDLKKVIIQKKCKGKGKKGGEEERCRTSPSRMLEGSAVWV